MKVERGRLDGVLRIQLNVHRDRRGFFVERFNAAAFTCHGLPSSYCQDNHSHSVPRTLRGLHFQTNPPQGKLIGVISGEIWDVIVDLRPQSPTFGQHASTELKGDDGRLLWVPSGFAHGFCVVGDAPAEVVYKVDAPYEPAAEGGILWCDPDLGIKWPVQDPILSVKDQQLPTFEMYRQLPAAW
jgi:dTDP-4-dehydrorhamnose 3,5-epimerase